MTDPRDSCPEDCPRRKEKLNHPCLQGCGPKNAKIMLVGENPGRTEDSEGEPFIGRSWEHVLQPIFNEFGLDRDEVYITNSVKCFTHREDPKPSEKEMNRCKPFLVQEIQKVKPNVIGALGATALKAILGRAGIKKLKNNVFWSDTFQCKVVPTWHPAWVLRNPGDYSDIRKGLQLIIDESEVPDLTDDNKTPAKYMVATSPKHVDKVLTALEKKDVFSFDLETRDLHYLSTPILTLGVSWATGLGIIIPWNLIVENEEFLNRVKDLLVDRSKLKIAQNIKFDTQVLISHKIKVKPPLFDTMLAHHLLDENDYHDLDGLVLQYTDMGEYWKELDDHKKMICKEKKLKSEDFKYDMFPKEILYQYGAKDADATFRLYELFSKKMKEQDLDDLYNEHVLPYLPVVIEMEYRGIKIEREKLKGLIEQYHKEIEEKSKIMYKDDEVKEYENTRKKAASAKLVSKYKNSKHIQSRYPNGPDQYIEKMLKDKDWRFNFGSPKQLREMFFEQMGLTPVKHTKTGPSTDEETLIELERQGVEFVGKLMEFRRLTKYVSTFLEATYKGSEYDGRIRPSYLQTGTVTGRLSSRNPNFQQIPRNAKDFKSCFLSDEGYTFIKADLAQAEFRCWAHYANDTDMIADIESGLDIHRRTASEVFGVPEEGVTSDQRTAAKNCVVGETWIPTKKGFEQIRNLKVGDVVLDHKNREQEILEVISKEDEVYTVHTECGSLTCTKDHPWYVVDDTCNLVTKPLYELKPGDFVLSCTPENRKKEYINWEYTGPRRTNFKPLFDKWILNEDLGYLIGFIMAEGSLSVSNSKVNVRWYQKGKYVKHIDKLSRKIFGKRVKRGKNNKTDVVRWSVCSVEFLAFLKYIGLTPGKYKGFKSFPPGIIQSPISVQKAFLQGYFLGDGTFKPDRVAAGTVCRESSNMYCLLLRSLGIFPKLSIEHPKGGREFYNLHITNYEELEKLIHEVGLYVPEGWEFPKQKRGRKFIHNAKKWYFKNHPVGDTRYNIKLRKKLTNSFIREHCSGINKTIDSLVESGIYSVKIIDIVPTGTKKIYDFITTGDKTMVANGFYTLDCVFGVMYGRGPNAIAQQYKISKNQAEQLRETFFANYPIAAEWLKEVIRDAKSTGQVQSWFGRVRRLPNIHSDDNNVATEAERQAMNSPIQSQATDMNNGYMVRTLKRARKAGIKCFPCGSVHDANFIQVRDDQLEDLICIMKEVVEETYPDFRCKMKLDFEIGKTLGELEEID